MPRSLFVDCKAAVFDAYGTLFNLGDIAVKFGPLLGGKAEELSALWRRKQLEYTWLRSLMGRHTDFWHVTGEALDHAMAALGLNDPSLRSRLMEFWLTPTAYPEAAGVLARLQEAGFSTAILSNGSPSMLMAGTTASGLGKLLDRVLSVESAGVFKPHPSVYDLACDAFGLEPREICFVSGNGWDVAGAAAFGFRVAWVNRAQAAREGLPAGPDAVIGDLSKLPHLLGIS